MRRHIAASNYPEATVGRSRASGSAVVPYGKSGVWPWSLREVHAWIQSVSLRCRQFCWGAVLVACLLTLKLVCFNASPEQVARQGVLAVVNLDTAFLSSHVRAAERRQCGLTAKSLRQLLVVLKFDEVAIETGPVVEKQHVFSARASVKLGGERVSPVELSLSAVDTKHEGVKLQELPASLVLAAAMMHRSPRMERLPTGVNYFRTLRDFLRANVSALEGTGVKGVIVFRPEGERFFSWRQYLADREALVERFESKRR